MLLRTRLTLLVLVAMSALWALSTLFFLARERGQQQELDATLLRGQQVAWAQVQGRQLELLQAAADRVLAHPLWSRAWATGDQALLGQVLAQVMGQEAMRAHGRLDVLDDRRQIVSTTSTAPQPEPIAGADAIDRARARQGLEAGIDVSGGHAVNAVVLRGFQVGGRSGVLALGMNLASVLPQVREQAGGEVFLVNLRGRELAATAPGLWAREQLAPPMHAAQVHSQEGAAGSHWRLLVQPLAGLEGRLVVTLVAVQDITARRHAQALQGAAQAGVVAAALLLMAAGVFSYLRFALRPLEQSVQVLGQLTAGDLRQAPDDDVVDLPDEAGAIARGVAALRAEMLNLAMLRDERVRAGQQQERLIRRQLKQLAETIDESSRGEILQALEQPGSGEVDGTHGNLIELAHLLGRMSGLVTSQQERLVRLLHELRIAMAQQAKLVALEQELDIARSMQLSILPRQAPGSRAVQLSALMIPAKEVGGDFYDYFMVDDDHLAVVVADVSGKGIPAAFFMAIARTLLKSTALFFREPAAAMKRLNEQLCAENEQMMFVTAFLGILDLRTGHLRFASAGHNPPVVRRRSGETHWLAQSQNIALAVFEGFDFVPGELVLEPGDTLLMYSDGVTEATDASGALYGQDHLIEVVSAAAPDAATLTQVVLESVRRFEQGAPQADDITCIVVRYTP